MATEQPTTTAPHVHSTWKATVRTILGAAAAVTLILLAFAWPSYTAKPKGMPLGVVATDAQRAQLQAQLDANGGPFTITAYPDRAAAVTAIEQRDVYGALVLPAAGSATTEALTASAGSAAATQLLATMTQKAAATQAQAAAAAKQAAATELAQLGAQAAAAQASVKTLQGITAQNPAQAAALAPQTKAATAQAATLGAQITAKKAAVEAAPMPKALVTDVVPLAATDSRGTGLAVAGLPLTMGGMIGGIMIALLLVGWKRRLVAVAGYGVLGGLLISLVLHTWFGFVLGNFAIIWLVSAVSLAATASFIVGAQALLGRPGQALGAVLTMFIGNPISSQQMPKEWLPGPWGQIGQWFVPGASGNLLRSESYFPSASVVQPWMALLGWLVVGVALSILGHHRDEELVHIEGAVEPDLPRHAS